MSDYISNTLKHLYAFLNKYCLQSLVSERTRTLCAFKISLLETLWLEMVSYWILIGGVLGECELQKLSLMSWFVAHLLSIS